MTNLEPVYMDTETWSETPIGDGTYKYAANAQVMLFTWAIGDGPVQCWDATYIHTMPKELFEILKYGKQPLVWQNSMFDRSVLKYDRGMYINPKRIHDTMVIALQHGLPGGLDKLCDIFKISEEDAKIKEGRSLVLLFCKPRPKNMELRRATSATHPEEWERFIQYAKNDITSMRAIYKKLPKWNHNLESERELWYLDQEINDRGFKVDVELAENAIAAIDRTQKILAKKTVEKTDGLVESATQRDKLLKHILMEHGVGLPDMTKSTLERRMNDTSLPQAVRELIKIRLDASTTSTSKYKKLINGVLTDSRLRGTLQFCGAQRTGRWAGRTFQPQNLPRPSHKQYQIEEAIDMIKANCLDLLSDDVMKLTSSAIRSCIIAEDGYKLVVSDLANIEGRIAAWLAGEQWKIKAFEKFDTFLYDKNGNKIPNKKGDDFLREGPDLYKLAYSRSFNVHPDEVTKQQRQLGKVQELALGYAGGVGAFVTMASAYRMDLEEVAANARNTIPNFIWDQAVRWWDESVKTDKTFGLTKEVFCVCDSLKRLWRNAQENIVQYWYDLDTAMRGSIMNPGEVFECGYLKVITKGAWTRIVLPSGRSLCYPAPEIDKDNTIRYLGVDPYTRKWTKLKTYGGKIFENVCQAVARDIMGTNMLAANDAGYKILLTVHDELITEATDENVFNEEDLSRILSTPPEWAPDIPLAAGGFEGYRYRKE